MGKHTEDTNYRMWEVWFRYANGTSRKLHTFGTKDQAEAEKLQQKKHATQKGEYPYIVERVVDLAEPETEQEADAEATLAASADYVSRQGYSDNTDEALLDEVRDAFIAGAKWERER